MTNPTLRLVALTSPPVHYHHPASLLLVVAGLIGGLAVGVTGMGGGALMTPMLVLLFRVDPKVAIASDLVNSLVMKPIGGGVHTRRGTIHWGLVGRLVVGSVPAAFAGAFLLNQLGSGIEATVKELLGWALLVACGSLIARMVLGARSAGRLREAGEALNESPYRVKTVPTVLVGVVGGFIVGMTSVGSGSLMMVLLMLLYPRLSSRSLVGTDLVQAVPLVASAALGQFVFGHIDFGLAGALILGSVPGVYFGARISARAPDGIVRPILVVILLVSALGLLFGSNNRGLAWVLVFVVLVGVPLWGAVDAALRRWTDWRNIRQDRTTWVAVMGIGAPFGIGFVAAIPYFARVRRRLRATEAARLAAAQAPG